jgi:hypothetical protein
MLRSSAFPKDGRCDADLVGLLDARPNERRGHRRSRRHIPIRCYLDWTRRSRPLLLDLLGLLGLLPLGLLLLGQGTAAAVLVCRLGRRPPLKEAGSGTQIQPLQDLVPPHPEAAG